MLGMAMVFLAGMLVGACLLIVVAVIVADTNGRE